LPEEIAFTEIKKRIFFGLNHKKPHARGVAALRETHTHIERERQTHIERETIERQFPLKEEIRLKIFGSPDCPVFLDSVFE